MIDGSEKRNCQLAFELHNSHVCEKRSNVWYGWRITSLRRHSVFSFFCLLANCVIRSISWSPRAACGRHFLSVWAQTLPDGRTLNFKKCFLCFSILTILGGKMNFERAWRDRHKCGNNFWKSTNSILKCTYVSKNRNKMAGNSKSELITIKPNELFKFFFSHFILSRRALYKLLNCFAMSWNFNFAVNLVTSFS